MKIFKLQLFYLLQALLFLFAPFIAKAQPVLTEDSAWHIIPVTVEPQKREDCSFVEVDGKFFLLGGRGIMHVEVFDPVTNTWQKKKQTPFEMHHFQAVALNHEIYVVGGMSGRFPHEKAFDSIIIYNPSKDEWRKGAEIPVSRRRGSGGTVVYKNKIYLVGGIIDGHWEGTVNWLDMFDPLTGKWEQLANAPNGRDHVHSVVIDDKIYVAGGRKTSHKTNKLADSTIAEVDVYDLKKQQWKTLPSSKNLPTLRAGATGVGYKKNLIVIGGESLKQQSSHHEVEVYNTKKNRWNILPPLVIGRHDTQAIYFKNALYIVAGSANRGGGPDQSSIEMIRMK